jgi:hypothetical protein
LGLFTTGLPIAAVIFVTTNIVIIVSGGCHVYGTQFDGLHLRKRMFEVDSHADVEAWEAGWGVFRDAYLY